METSNLNKGECCRWRENLELAIQRGDQEIMNECFYNWTAYSKKNGNRFACLNCQETLIEWGKINGVDFANSEVVFQEAQKKLVSG